MIAHPQDESVSTHLGLSRWEDWVTSGQPSPWTSAPPTQIHQYRAWKVRSFGKGKCIGWGQDMCVMGPRVLCCGGLWALAAPALGTVILATSVPGPDGAQRCPGGLFTCTKSRGNRDQA